MASSTAEQPSQRGPLLSMRDVSKGFPGVQALSGVDLELYPGEVLALAGENGAGKSTLMKLLSGIHAADAGEIVYEGEVLHLDGPADAQARGIGIIHQEFNLIPDLTVAQNLFIGREPRRWGWLDHRALNCQAQAYLDELHLPLAARQVVGDLTVAHQQMVEIAKALMGKPKVLIMDEPTAALNGNEVTLLHELIHHFMTPGMGVIYISHRMEELKAIAHRVSVIRDGANVGVRKVAGTDMDEIIALMVGRTVSTEHRPEHVRADRAELLRVRGLSTRDFLDDVSFDLREGEILGVAGLMGAGRTELARALIGADAIESGEITLRGRPIRIRGPADAAKHRIGYLSEDRKRFGLLLGQDVKFNITLATMADLFSVSGLVRDRQMAARSNELVDSLRIKTPSVRQPVKNLSGGNQQKVVIAKWLLKGCDILIFDEPTRGIDVGAKEEIYRLMNDLLSQGKSIIMISSELPEVLRMSHRIAVMCEGRLTAVLDADQADQEKVMHYATLSAAPAAETT
ncbi:sugar ABC transporter ATP-binding protein [Salinisphaera sp.]|uniref:sugar ABC transporter ATP-binding protein n=1 Tax=Salinisphaera sp. TaxID=1914330 RepID=UPI002D7816E1|nr:sugar ABC transporter ATP-binding protein [Salinisphaera sp.]HET7313661.1 sugar ABC transporter ATP-binding protein [Salinisphaera sp.]